MNEARTETEPNIQFTEKAENSIQRNSGIDILKVICSFLVICIHKRFLGVAGEYIRALSRVAVPVFFIISGYYLQMKSEDYMGRGGKKRLFKILKLIIF